MLSYTMTWMDRKDAIHMKVAFLSSLLWCWYILSFLLLCTSRTSLLWESLRLQLRLVASISCLWGPAETKGRLSSPWPLLREASLRVWATCRVCFFLVQLLSWEPNVASFSAAALISCIIRSGLIAVPLPLTDLHMVQQEKKKRLWVLPSRQKMERNHS